VDTYIVRIYRDQEKGARVSAGIVENAGTGRKKRFSDAAELLRFLKLERSGTAKKGEPAP